MKNLGMKWGEKGIALILVCIMLIISVPVTVQAEGEITYTFTVLDDASTQVDGATLSYTFTYSDNTDEAPSKVEGSATTDAEGKVTVSLDETKAISSIDYTVSKENYTTVNGIVTDSSGEGIQGTESTITLVKQVKVSLSEDITNGSVEIGDNAVTTEGRYYSKNQSIAITVEPNTGYMVGEFKVNDAAQTLTNNTYTIDSITEDTVIAVSFVEAYSVTITVDGEGVVTTDPTMAGDVVTVSNGTEVKITATPNTNYRVLKIVEIVDGQETEISGITNIGVNNTTCTYTTDGITSDKVYKIYFGLNQYNYTLNTTYPDTVDATTAGSPTSTVTSGTIEHGSTSILTMTQLTGYYVSEVKVNDVVIDFSEIADDENRTLTYTTDATLVDISIAVTYAAIPKNNDTALVVSEDKKTITGSGYTITLDTAILSQSTVEGVETFAITSDANATITPSTGSEYTKIGMNTSSSLADKVEITSTTTIDYITLGKGTYGGITPTMVDTSIAFSIDQAGPETEIVASAYDAGEFYSKDFTLSVSAIDAETGLQSITYKVFDDKEKTNEVQSGEITLSDSEVGTLEKITKEITIDTSKCDTEFVTAVITATDMSNNETSTTSTTYKVNTTKPSITVEIDGTVHSEGTVGYYNADRVAKVTIVDRSYTFDEAAATASIQIEASKMQTGAVIDKDSMIQWKTDVDGTYYAEISFTQDGEYSTNFSEITYTNKAGLSNETYTVVGDSSDVFTLDQTAPTAEIKLDTETWNTLLTTITFGIWKNYEVTGVATGTDVTSPLYDVLYYKSNSETALTGQELEIINANGEFTAETITVKADEKFVIYARVTDYAGNTLYISTDGIIIDMTAPVISIEYDNNSASNSSYFNSARTATIIIQERADEFDADKATNSITITAVDAQGNEVTLPSNMISDWKTTDTSSAEAATHQATIQYTMDANYTFDINYIDIAGNKSIVSYNESVAPTQFTIDTNKPTGTVSATSVEGREETWSVLDTDIRFGFWSNAGITIDGTSTDQTSPIDAISYYKSYATQALSASELDAIVEWQAFSQLNITNNEQFTIYIKIVDKAGNIAYISTDGLTVDNTNPTREVLAPQITISPQQPVNDIYNSNVTVDIKVVDPVVDNAYSGLHTITYKVLNNGVETQSGVLYEFDNTTPTQQELTQSWEGSIVVDAASNNSNNVTVEIYADDNALNGLTDSTSMKIDVTNPTILVSYDNNSPDSESYYSTTRTATVKITERNFDASNVKVSITNTDGTIPSISGWTTTSGSGNLDNTVHTATISYTADGDYTFDIAYTDMAGNACAGETFATGTANSNAFTIDQTVPVISVSYDNNSAMNGTYFSDTRVATVSITEHNFDVDRVEFTQTAMLNGASISNPTVSWSQSGDTHTATISYTADGDYTFDMSMKDSAGNSNVDINYGNSVASTEFTVDTEIEKPIITGVESGKAYLGSVILGIEFSDVNYDTYELQLLRTSKDKINEDVTAQYIKAFNETSQGGSGENDTFEEIAETDGIYTLSVRYQDMAGNEESEEVIFTINRFGSVYEYNQNLISLQNQYVQSVDGELVITEYNPTQLVADSVNITITKDSAPLEDTIYTVTPTVNNQVAVGQSGWYQYEYTIDASNFTEDGIYKISASSEDEVGNQPELTNYEDGDILFRVDTTPAEITSVIGLDENIVNAEKQVVEFSVFDAIGLQEVSVYVDDTLVLSNDTFESLIEYSDVFEINEGLNQNIKFVIVDLAGNITDTSEQSYETRMTFNNQITVSTNAFIRWYANKLLFWGSISGIIGAIGAVSFVIVRRKKLRK